MKNSSILLSGGSGLLGTAFRAIDSSIVAPGHIDMDVRDPESISRWIEKVHPAVFLHSAAFTSPPKVDADPTKAIEANIIGTANVVIACMKASVRLVYISTDYVFRGDRGNYTEEDEVYPQNKYAWSKLGGECAVRQYDQSLIIRTSFVADIFPYEKAFVDQYTSRDAVSVIAPIILSLAKRQDLHGVLHVGTARKTVFSLAERLRPDVKELRRNEVSFTVPADTSLNLDKLKALGVSSEV